MIETAIKSLLLGDSTISGSTVELTSQVTTYAAVVKSIVGKRIYRAQLPRNAATLMNDKANLPALWYWRTDTARQKTHQSVLDLVNGTVSLHAVGLDTLAVNQLLQSARQLLNNFKGSAGGVKVDKIWVEGGQDYFEDPIAAAELGLAESNVVLNCWFRETLA